MGSESSTGLERQVRMRVVIAFGARKEYADSFLKY